MFNAWAHPASAASEVVAKPGDHERHRAKVWAGGLLHLLVFYVVAGGIERLTGLNLYAGTLGLAGLLLLSIAVSVTATVLVERPYRVWYAARLGR